MFIKTNSFIKTVFIVWLSVMFFGLLSTAVAGPKVVPVMDAQYTINASMMDNLNTLVGKNVIITLDGGKVIEGTIKSVGSHLLHLEKIKGKEFYDALIRIQNIQAIETRFREYQR